MKKIYPYSHDTEFLKYIDSLAIEEQWVKITLLDYNSETPIEDIEGEISSGTLNKDGSSTVRRTCSLSCTVDAFTYRPDDIKAKYSIDKKIFLEVGITNNTDEYPDENIIWFPQGIMYISSFSISSSASGATTINLSFKDKIARLDGTIGGTIPATTRFDVTTSVINGVKSTKKVLVYDIIMEAVHHFGGEDIDNIIIDDVPIQAKRIIRWNGDDPVWIYPITGDDGEISYGICFDSEISQYEVAYEGKGTQYVQGQDIGYTYEDFVYDDELTLAAGSKVTDLLDKIKNWLGNFEYFYDEYGQFHFQEIKNYLNKSQSYYEWENMKNLTDTDYLCESSNGKAVYAFSDDTNLISVTNTPLYENIKNDFIVEGTTTTNNITTTVRYHLVIDDKPSINTDGYDNVLIYKDPVGGNYTIAQPIIVTPTEDSTDGWIWQLPDYCDNGSIYALLDEPQAITYNKKLKKIKDFKSYYDNIVLSENNDSHTELTTAFDAQDKKYFISLLESYLQSEVRDWSNSNYSMRSYRESILTILRRLKEKSVTDTSENNLKATNYLKLLYDTFEYNASIYEDTLFAKDLIIAHEDATLLSRMQSFYSDYEFTDKQKALIDTYKYTDSDDTLYWPSTGTAVAELLDDFSSLTDTPADTVLGEYKKWIYDEIDIIQNKQLQLKTLLSVYKAVQSNYTVLMSSIAASYKNAKTKEESERTEEEQNIIIRYKGYETGKAKEQTQIDLVTTIQDDCSNRMNALYSILTMYGISDGTKGTTYTEVNIISPAFVSSFWYFDPSTDTGHTYGWNELEWVRYFHSKTEPQISTGKTADIGYWHEGLGGMSYINLSKQEFWDDMDYSIQPIDTNYGVNFMTGYSDNYISIDNINFKIVGDELIVGDAVTRFTTSDCIYTATLTDLQNQDIVQFSDLYPSMNVNSTWYQEYYRAYAEANDLEYFKKGKGYSYIPKDWRVEIILQGMEAQSNGTDVSYYYSELLANWPNIYDFKDDYLVPSCAYNIDYFINETAVISNSSYSFNGIDSSTSKIKATEWIINDTGLNYSNANYNYFFDMIDSSSARWGEYSVGNIGRRTSVTVSDSVNCIFAVDTPPYAFINTTGMSSAELTEAYTELSSIAENIIQVTDSYYSNFATGGLRQSAYEQIKYDLQDYTSYQNTVSIAARPSFYLEPNVRVDMNDHSTGTVGDYVIKTISLPLGAGNNMSASLSKATERF